MHKKLKRLRNGFEPAATKKIMPNQVRKIIEQYARFRCNLIINPDDLDYQAETAMDKLIENCHTDFRLGVLALSDTVDLRINREIDFAKNKTKASKVQLGILTDFQFALDEVLVNAFRGASASERGKMQQVTACAMRSNVAAAAAYRNRGFADRAQSTECCAIVLRNLGLQMQKVANAENNLTTPRSL